MTRARLRQSALTNEGKGEALYLPAGTMVEIEARAAEGSDCFLVRSQDLTALVPKDWLDFCAVLAFPRRAILTIDCCDFTAGTEVEIRGVTHETNLAKIVTPNGSAWLVPVANLENVPATPLLPPTAWARLLQEDFPV